MHTYIQITYTLHTNKITYKLHTNYILHPTLHHAMQRYAMPPVAALSSPLAPPPPPHLYPDAQ